MVQTSRRDFITGAAAGFSVIAAAPVVKANFSQLLEPLLTQAGNREPNDLATDEAFWAEIRKGFELPQGVINLDNGYCNPLSREVAQDLVDKARYVEQLPGKRVETLYEEVTVPKVVGGLARVLGVPSEELALTRNATEALDTVILGMPMKPGDEILCCSHDYYAMLDAIEQRRKRDGISVTMLQPPVPATAESLVEMYSRAIRPNTKLVLVTHASNMTGQIYPVKRIASAAHKVGAEVLVDAAQTMALLGHKVPDLDCDYYAASLHKWLMCPVGAGVLWMRKQHVEKIWPLVPPPAVAKGMLKFQWSGTYPEFISAAAAKAIEFHERIGAARKEARIRHLADHWRKKLGAIEGVKFYTSAAPESSCGLGIFEWDGVDLGVVQKQLWEKEKILTQFMSDFGDRDKTLKGLRITPNVYTSTGELDRFVAALQAAAALKQSV